MSRPVGRPRTYDRARALRRVMEAFWSGGFTATSVRSLQEAAGMAPASLYAEFGGKDALFTAALDLYVDESRAWYRSTLDDGPPGLPALRRHFASYDFGDASRRGCLLVNSLGQRSEIPAPARRRVDAFFRWVEGRYVHHLEVARDAGALRPDADPTALAAGLVAFDQGLAVAATAPSRGKALRRAVAAWLDALEASPGRGGVPADP